MKNRRQFIMLIVRRPAAITPHEHARYSTPLMSDESLSLSLTLSFELWMILGCVGLCHSIRLPDAPTLNANLFSQPTEIADCRNFRTQMRKNPNSPTKVLHTLTTQIVHDSTISQPVELINNTQSHFTFLMLHQSVCASQATTMNEKQYINESVLLLTQQFEMNTNRIPMFICMCTYVYMYCKLYITYVANKCRLMQCIK